jgi:hypothetical protein
MKRSNNAISDWLDKYGDPEIDKNVEMELEKITRGIYNKFIDDAYKNYANSHTTFKDGFALVTPMAHSKESFIEAIKTDDEFAKKWGVKITERKLSDKERIELMGGKIQEKYPELIKQQIYHCDKFNIPTKKCRLKYKNEIVEYYE